jgi:hypothetical protein
VVTVTGEPHALLSGCCTDDELDALSSLSDKSPLAQKAKLGSECPREEIEHPCPLLMAEVCRPDNDAPGEDNVPCLLWLLFVPAAVLVPVLLLGRPTLSLVSFPLLLAASSKGPASSWLSFPVMLHGTSAWNSGCTSHSVPQHVTLVGIQLQSLEVGL